VSGLLLFLTAPLHIFLHHGLADAHPHPPPSLFFHGTGKQGPSDAGDEGDTSRTGASAGASAGVKRKASNDKAQKDASSSKKQKASSHLKNGRPELQLCSPSATKQASQKSDNPKEQGQKKTNLKERIKQNAPRTTRAGFTPSSQPTTNVLSVANCIREQTKADSAKRHATQKRKVVSSLRKGPGASLAERQTSQRRQISVPNNEAEESQVRAGAIQNDDD